jgi:hypothetical protein
LESIRMVVHSKVSWNAQQGCNFFIGSVTGKISQFYLNQWLT